MKTNIRTIIVDDEPLLIKTLNLILVKFCKEIEVIDTASDAFEAKQKIESLRPDLVFLDINMPKVNGFDLLKSFERKEFEIIFITAYDQYALEALKQGAISYLLKPILSEEVINGVERVKKVLELKHTHHKETKPEKQAEPGKKIVLYNNNNTLFLDYKDILWLEADRNYTKIYLMNGKTVSSAKPIKYYEDIIPKTIFFRIHKSYIINTEYIQEYFRDMKGPLVKLNETTKLRIAQPKQASFRKFIMNQQNKTI